MPLVPSDYRPPLLFRNGHLSTIYSGLIRRVNGLVQKRERIELSDGDFLDLDWSESPDPTNKVVILMHGLEGDAQRHYITGTAKHLNQNQFDACAINFRGCSGEPNRLYRSYHSGATDDLRELIAHILSAKAYKELYLMGYSLGGNLALKYLGESNSTPKEVMAAVGVSVPCDLYNTCMELLTPKNMLYARRFKRYLIGKLKVKQSMFPQKISAAEIKSIATLKDFDDVYTGPAHGFKDAMEYYEKCSCRQFLPNIKVPTLILNAKNDTFLGASCYPYQEAVSNPNLYLQTPEFGGHVGFWGKKNINFAEKRAVEFFKSCI